jgi:hypothetical protein
VLDPPQDKLGATLVARQLGHLAIKVTFHKHPCHDLEVKFHEAEADGSKGAQVGDTYKTDRFGVARHEFLVGTGVYVAEIENQPTPALVTTVSDPTKPFVVPLPVGRPYFDFDESVEFDDELREVSDYLSAGDGDAEAEDDESVGIMTVAVGHGSSSPIGDYPRLLLEATDGSYSREVSVRDALVDRGGWKQVVFRGLVPGTSYRLTRIVDEEHRIVVFDDAPYEAVVERDHEAGKGLEDHKLNGYSAGSPTTVEWGPGS